MKKKEASKERAKQHSGQTRMYMKTSKTQRIHMETKNKKMQKKNHWTNKLGHI